MSSIIGRTSTRYFVGVVSLEHATTGYNMGFTQACHGKKAPLSKMNKGDWFVQYSPKLALSSKTPYQKFSYIGTVATGNVYQVEMAPDFKPFRLDIDYLPSEQAQHAPIKPLINRLSFITNKDKWGAKFRFGFLEIPESDFKIIYNSMTGQDFDNRLSIEKPISYSAKIEETENIKTQIQSKKKKVSRLQHGYIKE